jgi:hypothetical protein
MTKWWASMVAFYALVGRWKNVSAASDIPPRGWSNQTNDIDVDYIIS